MKNIGAVYCVYENSGYLEESIRRIYELMDKIIILLNPKPWNSEGNDAIPKETFGQLSQIFDPLNKIEIVSKYWDSEAAQRNDGKLRLHQAGIKWCLIIDDDEFYNFDALQQVVISLPQSPHYVLLAPHRIYWKTPDYAIENLVGALPAICRTSPTETTFTTARMMHVLGGSWDVGNLTCHHYSYVRSDAQLKRKIETFSHAHDFSFKDWYEDIWLKWTPEMTNLHPNPADRGSFSKAVPTETITNRLEPSGYYKGSELERWLRASDFIKASYNTGDSEKEKFQTRIAHLDGTGYPSQAAKGYAMKLTFAELDDSFEILAQGKPFIKFRDWNLGIIQESPRVGG